MSEYKPPIHGFDEEALAMVQELKSLGFAEADQKEVLNYVIPYCKYFYRVYNKQHQYIWIITYNQKFIQAVVEVFLVARNTRAKWVASRHEQEKRGLTPLYASGPLDLQAIKDAVSITYQPTPPNSAKI